MDHRDDEVGNGIIISVNLVCPKFLVEGFISDTLLDL